MDYKEIAFDLRHRTREIQFKRGLGPNPNESDDFAFDGKKGGGGGGTSKHFPEEAEQDDDEPDTLDVRYVDKQRAAKVCTVLIQ